VKTWRDRPSHFASAFKPQNNFFIFCPKIACQAPKPPNSHKPNKIDLAC
jgi:hypothetical protein